MSATKGSSKRVKKSVKGGASRPDSLSADVILRELPSVYAVKSSRSVREEAASAWMPSGRKEPPQLPEKQPAFWRRRPNADLDRAGDWLLANLERLREEAKSCGDTF